MLDIKKFNNKSLAKQAKKGEQIVSMMPDFEKDFELMCDDRVKLSGRKDALKTKIEAYKELWRKESKAKLLKQIDDGKKQI